MVGGRIVAVEDWDGAAGTGVLRGDGGFAPDEEFVVDAGRLLARQAIDAVS